MRNIFGTAVVSVVLLLLCLLPQAYAKSPPPGTGKADVPANILFMVDTSGSMGQMVASANIPRYPTDVAVDSVGNTYVVEHRDHWIKKFDTQGNLLRKWGGYGGSNGKFRYPLHIALDSSDNVYVSDSGNNRIQKFDSKGIWQKNFSVDNPYGVDVDTSGNVYAGAFSWGQIFKFNSSGTVVKKWSAHSPFGLSVRGSYVYVAQYYLSHIGKYKTDGTNVTAWYCYSCVDVEATANGIYGIPLYHHKVNRYSETTIGQVLNSWGGYGSVNTKFRYPYGLGSDSSGNIYVADYYNYAIKKFTRTGSFMSSTGGENRLEQAKKVIKKLVSDPDLTKGANFGLMDWNSSARMKVYIKPSGAAQIYKDVDSLYASGGTNLDRAMQLAESYFLGGNTPITPNASCQKNFLIVISDGSWYDRYASGIAASLYKNNGIKTFVVGFHSAGGANYVKLAKKGGTHPDSPLYTSNWQNLYSTLSTYIRQAIASQLTFTVPFIMPSISADDHIFQSTFTYKKTHQWQGKLSKYKLKADGSIGSLVWEAGKKLDKKSASKRQIWTVGGHVGLPSGMNNFVTANKSPLKDLLWEHSGQTPTDTEVENLIKFVRGVDAYDEDADNSTTDERWKLGDIYHSELTVVGKPAAATTDKNAAINTEAYYRHQNNYEAFKGQQANRKSTVYVGANDGMLHAFDSASGDELWAFIPPAMLPNLRNMISTKANSSVSIYGVDGSPVVKDVFYQNKWITMLIAGMGRGGHSYFALDVTKRTAPKFLFSFSNDPTNKQIYYWSASGKRVGNNYATAGSDYDYSKLGEAWSTPSIVLAPMSGAKRKWVAAFGAGFNAGINPNYGSAVYVVDLENQGKVLSRIDLADNSGGFANALPSQLTAITADTTSVADYSGAMLYAADLESKVWKINLTNDGSLYSATNLFDGQGDDNNGRSNFFPVTSSIGTDGKLWLYFGTGDQQKLQHMSGTIQNRIFGLKDNNFPKYKSVSTALIGKMKNTSGKGSICPTDADIGWYINLAANEKVTGKIAIHNESLFVSRYTPNKTNICNPGTNLLSEHGYGCGKAEKETKLGAGILTGAVVYKGQIYIGISGVPSSSSGTPAAGFTQHGNIIIGKPSKSSSTGGTVTQESWRELF